MNSMKSTGDQILSPINVLMLTVLVDMTGFGMIIPLIPFYAQEFASGPSGIGLLIASFSLMQFIFSPLLGRISDTRGRRSVLLFSILTSIGSFFLFTLATSYLVLLLSRIVAGLATEGAVAQAYIADITSKEERSAGIGKIGAAIGVGFILGPVIGGLLSPYGFKAPGTAALVLSVLNFGFVFFFLPEPERTQQSTSNINLHLSVKNMWRAVKEPITGQVYLIFFIVTLAFAAVPVIVPLLAIDYYGFTEVEMSYVFIFIGLIQVFLQGFAIKKLVNRIGEEKLIIFGPVLLLAGVVLTPILRNIPGFGIATILTAIGVGISNTAVPGFISLMTPHEEQGSTLGITQSIGSVARIFGPILSGYIVEISDVQSSFYVSGFMLLLSFLIGCRIFRACTLSGLLEPLDRRDREDLGLIPPS
jgi:DHA1 family tetracycline resistance protein-like MFS transporter